MITSSYAIKMGSNKWHWQTSLFSFVSTDLCRPINTFENNFYLLWSRKKHHYQQNQHPWSKISFHLLSGFSLHATSDSVGALTLGILTLISVVACGPIYSLLPSMCKYLLLRYSCLPGAEHVYNLGSLQSLRWGSPYTPTEHRRGLAKFCKRKQKGIW